uniref:Uncharacterized protein n=1 Tax=Anguilla anguilla TaxID=7936 RepID=A0A0E9VTX4_ANGAN
MLLDWLNAIRGSTAEVLFGLGLRGFVLQDSIHA